VNRPVNTSVLLGEVTSIKLHTMFPASAHHSIALAERIKKSFASQRAYDGVMEQKRVFLYDASCSVCQMVTYSQRSMSAVLDTGLSCGIASTMTPTATFRCVFLGVILFLVGCSSLQTSPATGNSCPDLELEQEVSSYSKTHYIPSMKLVEAMDVLRSHQYTDYDKSISHAGRLLGPPSTVSWNRQWGCREAVWFGEHWSLIIQDRIDSGGTIYITIPD
jgi:hypothetical protein